MSDILRKQLVSRLQKSEKILITRKKTPTDHLKLIPNLYLQANRSTSTIRRNEKLKPISPFIVKKNEGAFTERTTEEVFIPKPPEISNRFKRKFITKVTPTQKNSHVHGGTDLLEGTSNKIFDFIGRIKKNKDLHDDFWYFNKGENYYDLSLTTFNEKNPTDYFTLSYRGIAHFIHGEVIFINLEDWEREYYLYRKFQKISFFSNYRKWKCFSIWMRKRRMNMMENIKQYLLKTLSFLNTDLQEPLLNIRQKCYLVIKTDMLGLTYERPRALVEFMEERQQVLNLRSLDLKSLYESIAINLKNTCAQSTEKFIKNNITGNILDKIENYSIKVLPYTHEAVLRSQLKRLGRFIKLIDFMLTQSKLMLSHNICEKLYKYIKISDTERINQKAKILFLLESNFTEKTIFFTPGLDSIKENLQKTLKDSLDFIFSFPLLIEAHDSSKYLLALYEFTEDYKETDLNVEYKMRSNQELDFYNNLIGDCLDGYFSNIRELSTTWQPYIKQFNSNRQLKLSKLKNYDARGFDRVIEKYKKQVGVFCDLVETVDLDVFRINFKPIKSKLVPSPAACLEKIENFLPELVSEKSGILRNDISSINQKLFKVPANIHEYIIHIQEIEQIGQNSENIALQILYLREFIELLQNCKILNINLKEDFAEIIKIYEKMKSRLSFLYMRSESEKAKFIRILKTETKKVEKRLEVIKNTLENPMLKDVNSPSLVMIGILDKINQNMLELYNDTKKFIIYQDLLGLPRSNFSAVETTKAKYDITKSLWDCSQNWEIKIKARSQVPIAALDIESISRDADKFYKISLKSKILEEEENYIGRSLYEKVEKVRVLIPIITELRFGFLKQRHLESIQSLIPQTIEISNPNTTLDDMISSGMHTQSNSIYQILLTARKEQELEKQFQTVSDAWAALEFTVKYDKEKEIHIFTDIESINNKIKNTQKYLSTTLASPYIEYLYDTIHNFDFKFKLFTETFELLILCQKKIMDLEDNVDRLKKSNSVHNGLRDLMKKAYKNPAALEFCNQDGLINKLKVWNNILDNV